tara:strand:+ start:77 stop:454 length:378 start_codon:yes stop_codon:yes gene_type:complete
MTQDTNKIYEPRLGWYKKVDVLENAPQFTGTPKDIILLYLHMIKIYKRNLGRLTIYDTRINIQGVNTMTSRVKILTKNFQTGVQKKNADKLDKIARKHWKEFHNKMKQNGDNESYDKYDDPFYIE